jgi:hypothetical protein
MPGVWLICSFFFCRLKINHVSHEFILDLAPSQTTGTAHQRHYLKDCAQVGVKRLWLSFYLVWRPSLEEFSGPVICWSISPHNRWLLLALTAVRSDYTFHLPFSGPWENTVWLKCRHLHPLAQWQYKCQALKMLTGRICLLWGGGILWLFAIEFNESHAECSWGST